VVDNGGVGRSVMNAVNLSAIITGSGPAGIAVLEW
jgi:hypothetical protein